MLKQNQTSYQAILDDFETKVKSVTDKYPHDLDFEDMICEIDVLKEKRDAELKELEEQDTKDACSHPPASQQKASHDEILCSDCGLEFGAC